MKQFFLGLMTDRNKAFWTIPVKGVLRVLSWVYGIVVAIRNGFYESRMLPSSNLGRPVISVGNIVMGGVGKTPVVAYLVRFLTADGKHPAVLMRGYMDRGQQTASDEAAMLKTKFNQVPVLIGSNRVEQAKQFLSQDDCDVFIMDDGFQRRQVKRDLNILVIDSANPFGNGALIPRGILREPHRALKRADMILLSKTDLVKDIDAVKDAIKQFNPSAPVVETIHKPVSLVDPVNRAAMGLTLLNSKKVFCLSSIGNPQGFKKTVESLGAQVVDAAQFIDHYSYLEKNIVDVIDQAKSSGAEAIITTEKDIVKLEQFYRQFASQIDVYVLGIEIDITEGKNEFNERLDHIF